MPERGLMAIAAADIREALAGNRNELPVVPIAPERQLQHSPTSVVADLAVGKRSGKVRELRPTGADDELAHATSRIHDAVRALRSEALITVIVRIDHHVGAGLVQRAPYHLHVRITPVRASP